MAEQADHDDDKDEGSGEAAAEAPAEKAPEKKATSAGKPAASAKPKTAKKGAEGKAAPKGAKAEPKRAPPPSSASLGKSMVLFVVVVGTLAAGFALLGQERSGGSGPHGPTWKVGDKVDVEITLVASDKRELGCASSEEIAGRHCGSEAANKPWSKGENTDDKKILRPYTSTDNVQFVAAGLWSEPALATSLPATRFTVKCKYTVEGKVKAPTFHWESGWEGQPRGEMLAGLVTDCKLLP